MRPSRFLLLLGPDRPRKLQRIQALARELQVAPLDRHDLDATRITPAELVTLCRQQPALSVVQLIVVDQAHRLARDAIERLAAQAQLIQQVACVVLVTDVELPKTSPLAQASSPWTTELFPARETPHTRPFALIDAIAAHDAARALSVLREQLRLRKDVLELYGLLSWQIQRWLTAKRLVEQGESLAEVAHALSLRAWQVARLQTELAHWSLGALQRHAQRCWEVERGIKRGRIAGELALEVLVLELCGASD